MNGAVRLDLVHGSQPVLYDHKRNLVAVVDLLQVILEALGVDRPAPVALLEVRVAGAAEDIAALACLGVGGGGGAHVIAEGVEVHGARLERSGVLIAYLNLHALALPQGRRPRGIRAAHLDVAAVKVVLALLTLRLQHIGGVAGARIGGVAGDHAAHLVLRVDLMRHDHALCARQELVVQGVESRLRVVPVARAEGHGHVLEPLRHHAAAHHAAKSVLH